MNERVFPLAARLPVGVTPPACDVKDSLAALGVLVTGALLGSFLGKFVGMAFPTGRVHDLFATDLVAGLRPATLDLRVIELTFGCLFKFNMMSVAGVVVAAFLFKSIWK